MQEEMLRQQLVSTCQGIQLLYRSRKAGISHLENEMQRLVDEWHNELVPARLNATEPSELAKVKQLQTENRSAFDFNQGELRRKRDELRELENDFQFNECSLLLGSIV